MGISFLPKVDVCDLERQFLDDSGNLKIVPSGVYSTVNYDHLRLFCHKYGFYCLPTTELIGWLILNMSIGKTIEIGAGNGAVGRALGIPITDSCAQQNPEVASFYKSLGQPVTHYPRDIIKVDALTAIRSFRPEVVVACWVTHKYNPNEAWREGSKWGIEERLVLKKIKKYILIGHEKIHNNKPIMDLPHETFYYPWLWSRAEDAAGNRIYVWTKEQYAAIL